MTDQASDPGSIEYGVAALRDLVVQNDLSEEQLLAILSGLNDDQLKDVRYDWKFWARPEQLPPPDGVKPWEVWLIKSGRGWGKGATGSNFVIERAKQQKGPMAIIGQTVGDVRSTMIQGVSGILHFSPPDFYPNYEPSKRTLTWPNGVKATTFSGDSPDQLRGANTQTAWVDELAKFRFPERLWEEFELGFRIGDPRVCVTTTPRPIKIIKQLEKDPGTIVVQRPTYDNLANLSSAYIRRIIRRYEGTRLAAQELYGITLDEFPGAMWQPSLLDDCRVSTCPPLRSIVVAIDPAEASDSRAKSDRSSNNEDSDLAEVGIIAAGLGDHDNHVYIIADATGFMSPGEWAKKAVDLYKSLGANVIVAERNKGGKMVEHTIHTEDSRVPVKLVWASQGKDIRAEPVAALYEQRRVHHVGYFGDLESQMCSFVPRDTIRTRLDRMDAMVYAVTHLLLYDEEMPHLPAARVRRWRRP